MHLDTAFRVLAKCPFGQFDTTGYRCRVYCEDLPTGKEHIWNVLLCIHRTDFLYEPHTKIFEDSVIPDFVCLGQGRRIDSGRDTEMIYRLLQRLEHQ